VSTLNEQEQIKVNDAGIAVEFEFSATLRGQMSLAA
jgi:hypothetical protein